MKNRLAFLQSVFEFFQDGIAIVSCEGTILWTNAEMDRIYHLKKADYVGKKVNALVEQGVFGVNVTSHVVESGRPYTALQYVEKKVELLNSGVPVLDDKGLVELVIVISHDVSELNSLKKSLLKAETQAETFKDELTGIRIIQMQEKDFVASSKAMRNVLDLTHRLACVDTTVMILGESGVGKEMIATLLHRASPRRSNKALIKVNCAAIPAGLLEAELFGYVPGAFTGATKEGKAGLFEMANDGSIFLDEISELPFDLQAKLLRVLQERELTRLGGTKSIKIDVRIIAATNKDLLKLVEEGRFREDLYYRLSVVPLVVPPLRERREDIVTLTQHSVRYFNQKYGLSKVISAELMDILENYRWPGNVRELMNVIERMMVTSTENVLGYDAFPQEAKKHECATGAVEGEKELRMTLEEIRDGAERRAISALLKEGFSVSQAARRLNVSRATLIRKISRLGLRESRD